MGYITKGQCDVFVGGLAWRTAVAEADLDQQVDTYLEQHQDEALEPMYRVLIHNDEVTPMEFVVMILQKLFQLSLAEAEFVMLTAHYTGLAHVVSLPLNEARSRVGKAHFAAQLEGYPLTFTIEPE